MKRVFRVPNINSIILAVYLLIVWLAFACLHAGEWPLVILLTAVIIIALAVFLPRLLNLINGITLKGPGTLTGREKAKVFIIVFLCTAAVLLIWRLACWPGGFAPDSGRQLEQALSGVYTDWHPVWHTLVFFSLPMAVTGSKYSIFIFQDLVFCAAMAHMLTVVYIYAGRRFAIISWCYLMLNPFICYMEMLPLKDVPFALSCMTAAVLSVQIWCTRGRSADSWIRCAALGISLANAALFRHNGILFSWVLLLALLFVMKNRWWRIVLVFALVFLSVRIPLYRALEVQKPDLRVSETTAMPMSVIGNVVTETPELLDDDIREFAYSVVPREKWETDFERGNYNNIKWYLEDAGPVESAGRAKILNMAWRSFLSSPKAALSGFIDLTDIVYGMHKTLIQKYIPYYYEELIGIPQRPWGPAESAVKGYERLCNVTPLRFLFTIGASMIIMLTVTLAKCDLKKREDRKRILMVLSVFCYNFGTMMLLGGPDYRFFTVSFLVCPAFVMLMLCERDPENTIQADEEIPHEDEKEGIK